MLMLKAPDKTPPPSTAPAAATLSMRRLRSFQLEQLPLRSATSPSTTPAAATNFGFGVYTNGVADGSFSMLHVTATATGGTGNYGVRNDSSSPSMTNVTATADSNNWTHSYGVYNFDSSSPTMTNVTATGKNAVGNNMACSTSRLCRRRRFGTRRSPAAPTASCNSDTSSAKVADTDWTAAVDGGSFSVLVRTPQVLWPSTPTAADS